VLSSIGEQADVDFASTEIESSVQHVERASSVLVFRDTTSVSPEGPFLMAVRSEHRSGATASAPAPALDDA
jgi:hypothetical protein